MKLLHHAGEPLCLSLTRPLVKTPSNRWNLSVIPLSRNAEHDRGESSGPPPLPRAELGIHGLESWPGKSPEKSEKRGVHAARNAPSEDRKCWERLELGIQDLKSWGRNWSRKVRETRSTSSQKRSEPAAHPCRGPGGHAGAKRGGPPWFKGTRGRGRTLCGTNISFYKIRSHQYWTGDRFRLGNPRRIVSA